MRGSRIPYEEAEEKVQNIQPEDLPESTWEQKYAMGIALGLLMVLVLVLTMAFAAPMFRRIRYAWRYRKTGGGKYGRRR